MNTNEVLAAVTSMAHSQIHNYVVPGLTSALVGGVRLFSSSRDTREWVTPHSHRYDFTTLVLKGLVENILFTPSPAGTNAGNQYAAGTLRGGLGDYTLRRPEGYDALYYTETRRTYRAGETYSMTAEEIHSIRFNKGAEVLIFEGPPRLAETVFLEPFVDGKVVRTFTTRPWMFEKESERQ